MFIRLPPEQHPPIVSSLRLCDPASRRACVGLRSAELSTRICFISEVLCNLHSNAEGLWSSNSYVSCVHVLLCSFTSLQKKQFNTWLEFYSLLIIILALTKIIQISFFISSVSNHFLECRHLSCSIVAPYPPF